MHSDLVPNFVGATLPRKDQGDREYYSSTMLTLFRPWRNGKDLKHPEQTWDDAFMTYAFTDRQRQIMDNLHIKYECHDAADDFYTQLKKGAVTVPGWNHDSDNIFGAINDEAIAEYLARVEDDPYHEDIGEAEHLGLAERRRREKASTILRVLDNTGWLTEYPDRLPDDLDLNTEAPALQKSSNQWDAEVKTAKQRIIAERACHFAGSSCRLQHTDPKVNIVDKSYLEKSAHQAAFKPFIEPIIEKFNISKSVNPGPSRVGRETTQLAGE